jgi:hypothetical protein
MGSLRVISLDPRDNNTAYLLGQLPERFRATSRRGKALTWRAAARVMTAGGRLSSGIP